MERRKWLTAIAASAGMLALILDSRAALSGAAQGIELCMKTVIPSLFPFLFLSGIFSAAFSGTNGALFRLLGKVFSFPAHTEYLVIPAFLGGYPVGAQCVFQAYQAGLVEKKQAERMLAFCSNAGPSFIFGILSSCFQRKALIFLIWGIQILSAWTAARLFSFDNGKTGDETKLSAASFGIETAIQAMLKICGWVILFRILISFLDRWFLWMAAAPLRVAIIGLLELSNGCCSMNLILREDVRFLVCSFLLAFGGTCVAYQTASVCHGLGLGYYFMGKLAQGCTAVFLAAAIYYKRWLLLVLWMIIVFFTSKYLKKTVEIPSPVVYNGA